MAMPIFKLDSKCRAIPLPPGDPDGKTILTAQQMEQVTGEKADDLLRGWFETYGSLLAAGSPPPAAPIEVEPDPTKVTAGRAELYDILRERFFPLLDDEDILAVLRYAQVRRLDPWAGHVWAARQYDKDLGRERLFVGVKIDGLTDRLTPTAR
jgi:hypothetical protein